MSRIPVEGKHCHHRTSAIQTCDQVRQQAGRPPGSNRFPRRRGHPLGGSADALARVAAFGAVLRLDSGVPVDLGANGTCQAHYTGARRRDRGQCLRRRDLGNVADGRSAIRSTRRQTRIGTCRRPLRVVAADLCRDGSRLGLVPRPPPRADPGICEHDRPSRRRCVHRTGICRRSGLWSQSRPPCTGRGGTRSPRGEHRTGPPAFR